MYGIYSGVVSGVARLALPEGTPSRSNPLIPFSTSGSSDTQLPFEVKSALKPSALEHQQPGTALASILDFSVDNIK